MITVYGENASLEDLRHIPLMRPENAGSRWKGVQHHDAVDAILSECDSRNWEIKDMKFSLAGPKDNIGSDLVGAIDLRIPSLQAPEGQEFSLGIMTSNSMKWAMLLFAGTTITICHNGMATGEIVLARKHTLNFNIGEAVPPALDEYFIAAKQIKSTVNRLRHNVLQPNESDHLILEAGRRQMLPWSRIGAVDAEYRNPQYSEHGRGTSWALLNAFTEVVKRSPVHAQMNQMNKFRDILPLANDPVLLN